MSHSIILNSPISSPLHPQLNLPLLKDYLAKQGYKSKVVDSNIKFFHYFLDESYNVDLDTVLSNPLSILSFYADLEKVLFKKSENFEKLHVGLRSLSMKHNRTYFDTVLESLEDKSSNPFIEFYENEILDTFKDEELKIIGISITFQDQIIAAFTLANLIRKNYPNIKIVMGGQMITRCQDSMIQHKELCKYFDYLVLWDGEKGFADIHKEVIDNIKVNHVNVIPTGRDDYVVDRKLNSLNSNEIPSPDFSDLDFNSYLNPELLIPFQTTRGCYAKCEFCAIPFGSNAYKVRTVDNIIDDMIRIRDDILKRHNRKVTYFKFMEDTSSPILLYNLSVEIEKRNLDFKWETFVRLEKAFTKPGMMEQLYRGGCRKLHWGFESNDPDILKKMNKKTSMSYTDDVLRLSGEAGILNFCFVLIGFPGETDKMRENVVKYIVGQKHIHTLTLATFDLTRGSPMEQDFVEDNVYKMDMEPAQDFQVRLPYFVGGENWKSMIVPKAHRMMIEIIKGRPDIGFMTLFPDQIRSIFCDQFTNEWGRIFVEKYGKEGVSEMLLSSEAYADNYENKKEINADKLPEPLKREHERTKEDLELIAKAMEMRKLYEKRRFTQV
ncbi:hypothetical protein BVY03_03375 [bacterium K02(2017)]|nr:hypothetical protein BVY03_03375 [bacterium K02(2017)]